MTNLLIQPPEDGVRGQSNGGDEDPPAPMMRQVFVDSRGHRRIWMRATGGIAVVASVAFIAIAGVLINDTPMSSLPKFAFGAEPTDTTASPSASDSASAEQTVKQVPGFGSAGTLPSKHLTTTPSFGSNSSTPTTPPSTTPTTTGPQSTSLPPTTTKPTTTKPTTTKPTTTQPTTTQPTKTTTASSPAVTTHVTPQPVSAPAPVTTQPPPPTRTTPSVTTTQAAPSATSTTTPTGTNV